jgi:XapX domain-containing protein
MLCRRQSYTPESSIEYAPDLWEEQLKTYLVSLAAGVLVGIVYGLLNVRSPAPPVIALVGLLGILLGEQVVPASKHFLSGHALNAAWIKAASVPHVLGRLPTGQLPQQNPPDSVGELDHTNTSKG